MKNTLARFTFILAMILTACNSQPTLPSSELGTLAPQVSYWKFLGGPLNVNSSQDNTAHQPTLALDNAGSPVVAWYENDGISTNIYVKHWNGASWTQLGDYLDVNPASYAAAPSLAIDNAGNPVVAWREFDGTAANVYVKRWNGSAWTQLGTTLNVNANPSFFPSLAVDNAGNPTVVWEESHNIYVKRWNGSTWHLVGANPIDFNMSEYVSSPFLAIDSSGNPVAAWSETFNIYVKRFNGTNWNVVGTGPINDLPTDWAYDPSLSLDNTDNPLVAWEQGNSLYVKRWTGSAWTTLNSISIYSPPTPSLAVDNIGNPVMAWDAHGSIYVQRYTSIEYGELYVNISGLPSSQKRVRVTGANGFDSGSSRAFHDLLPGTYTISAQGFRVNAGRPTCRLYTPDFFSQTATFIGNDTITIDVIYRSEPCGFRGATLQH